MGTAGVAHKGRLRRVEGKAFSGHGRIRLKNGEVFRFPWERTAGELWAYSIHMLFRHKPGDPLPPEPEVLTAIKGAVDPKAAMQQFRPDDPSRALVDPGCLFDEKPPLDPTPDLSEGREPSEGGSSKHS
jgi:hypothetical protein